MGDLLELTDATFRDEVLEASLPVLVDFTAEWCAPCHRLAPIVEELARELSGKLKVVKLDIDANMNTTMEHGVMSVPTLILFVGGQARERLVGLMPKERILAKLNPHMN